MSKSPTAADARHPPRIVLINISDLSPAEYNPRTWDDAMLDRLCESIRRFGFVDPVIANGARRRRNVMIGGHMRLAAAQRLGLKAVPVVYVDLPDIEKEKELNLRLNRDTGQWDFDKLKAFDVELLLDVGFDDADLSHVWDDTLETEDDGFNTEEEAEKIDTPTAKPGDLYEIAGHRVICGDSADPAVIERLMGEELADMVYTDPIYNISLDYSAGISNKMQYGGKTDDSKSDEEYGAFLRKTLGNALAGAKENCHFFSYCDQRYLWLLQTLFPELGLEVKRVCLWIKNNANLTPQVAFNKCFEPCVYGTRGDPCLSPGLQNLNEILNKEVGTGNRAIDDILDLLDIWLVRRLHGSEYTHATEKPPTLHEKAIRRCTKPGDLILDVFGGSGSTAVAAHQLKRRCFLAEIEPIFVDLILKRLEKLTGQKPSLLKP